MSIPLDIRTDFEHKASLENSARRKKIFFRVLVVHLLIIFVPLSYLFVKGYFKPEKAAISVKLANFNRPPTPGPKSKAPPKRTRNRGSKVPPKAPTLKPSPAPAPMQPKIAPSPRKVPVQPNLVSPQPSKAVRTRPLPTKKKIASRPPRQQQNWRPATESELRKILNPPVNHSSSALPVSPKTPAENPRYGGNGGGNNETAVGDDGGTTNYAGVISAHLLQVWAPPANMELTGTLETYVSLTLSRDGRILSARITRNSGVKALDESVRRALLRLDKLPPPPIGFPSPVEIVFAPSSYDKVSF